MMMNSRLFGFESHDDDKDDDEVIKIFNFLSQQ